MGSWSRRVGVLHWASVLGTTDKITRRTPPTPKSDNAFRWKVFAQCLALTSLSRRQSCRGELGRKPSTASACRYQVQDFLWGTIVGMAQPHKGQREQIKVRAAAVVYARLREMAAQRGTSVSQLSADLLAIAVGHPEAVRELDKEVLPLAM